MPKVYRYVTDYQWAILDAAVRGVTYPLWHYLMGPLRPLIDARKRGWLRVTNEGGLVPTPAGLEAWNKRKYAVVPLRDPEGPSFRAGRLTDNVQQLLTQQAIRAIREQFERASLEAQEEQDGKENGT